MTDCIAFYRLPLQTQCVCVSGKGKPLGSFRELNGQRGFVVAPFQVSEDCPVCVIEGDARTMPFEEGLVRQAARGMFEREDVGMGIRRNSTEHSGSLDCEEGMKETGASGREIYGRDFRCFHEQLEKGVFSKLVLARRQPADCVGRATDMFCEACRKYPRMFITLFSTPWSGTWLVATPEVLLEGCGDEWHTMALAGTMPLEGDDCASLKWSAKNIREQRYVATYISDSIRTFATDLKESGPYTVRAGHLVHLRSDFTFAPRNANVGDMADALHPTPAVCGLPKEEARQFIMDHEHCHRQYYSGFSGPIGMDGGTQLFVTLRCMKILGRRCEMYAGGGLLMDSIEEQEWEETETKMMVMRRLNSEE